MRSTCVLHRAAVQVMLPRFNAATALRVMVAQRVTAFIAGDVSCCAPVRLALQVMLLSNIPSSVQ